MAAFYLEVAGLHLYEEAIELGVGDAGEESAVDAETQAAEVLYGFGAGDQASVG